MAATAAQPQNPFLERLDAIEARAATRTALLGFDGCIDRLFTVVREREHEEAALEAYTPYATIESFGAKLVASAGLSCIVEILPKLEKVGGNGPIMAGALAAAGLQTTYVGPLGEPQLHPAFEAFGRAVSVHSVGAPAETHALEFDDGKVMLAQIANYHPICLPHLLERIGAARLLELFTGSDLCALLNWSCIPHLAELLRGLLELLDGAGVGHAERLFFFDLADPARKSDASLAAYFEVIGQFTRHGRSIVGLNLNEAVRVSRALGLKPTQGDAVLELARSLDAAMAPEVAVMVHTRREVAYAHRGEHCAVLSPYTETPRVSTGAGDHLNAGFCLGLLGGASPREALGLGVLWSGYYVRHGTSPDFEAVRRFASELPFSLSS